MKKNLLLAGIVFLSFGLLSCDKDKTLNDPLVISEFIENDSNSALELYNRFDEEIDLSDYSLKIYFRSVITIPLEGKLEAKNTYVIVQESEFLSDELRNRSDFIVNQLIFSGRNAIELCHDGKTIDILGDKENIYSYCEDKGIVRKTNYLRSTTKFDEYEWIRYPNTTLDNLNSATNNITEEELLAGPQLTDEDLERPFVSLQNSSLGGGGVITVTVSSYGDGDTTNFYFPDTGEVNAPLGTTRVRYQNVDTRETMADLTQEWGVPAKNFTNSELQNADVIQVQSVLNGSLYETFDRLLGWVWVDGELLNFKLVKEGYSQVQFGESQAMYKGVLYTDFLYHAELYAKRNGLKIHGEEDPTWDYEHNRPKEDDNV